MHDFINTILRYFSKALAPALLAALLAGGALFLYYVWRKDRGCPSPSGGPPPSPCWPAIWRGWSPSPC